MEINIPEGKEVDQVKISVDELTIVFNDVVTPWYENLGKGKLCWVWDVYKEDNIIVLVTKHIEFNDYPFKALSGSGWKNATPLTPDEIKEFTVCSN